ncbi:protein S100-A11 [Anolis sagrei]|uniref:protein S100-A11 n=1 Tax=Anolis sagrei TaxID=38937 RepID=UPI0035225641
MSSRYAKGPTETERCIESLLAIFHKHAERDGDATSLSKQEFKQFMTSELGSLIQKDPAIVDRIRKKIDMNNDDKIDFLEFLNLLGGLAEACHRHVTTSARH